MTTEDILAELRSETAKLFEDNKLNVKTDPEKTYLDYLKATRSRSQFTIYDEEHNSGESFQPYQELIYIVLKLLQKMITELVTMQMIM